MKRIVLLPLGLILVFIMVSGQSQADAPPSLTEKIAAIESRIEGRVGVSVLDTAGSGSWSYRGDERFPLMSTFKTLACANMLFNIDSSKMSKHQTGLIEKQKLIAWSPVTEKMVGQNITIYEACEATMLTSDNTAANLVLANIGGPPAVTSFLRQIGDNHTRLDRIEPDLGEAKTGDTRDTTTPNAMVKSLHTLVLGDILSSSSRSQLKQWMLDNTVTESLLRSILPEGWLIADRSGAGGNGSRGITSIIWPDEGEPLVVGIYLTETGLSLEERDKIIVEIGQIIFDNSK